MSKFYRTAIKLFAMAGCMETDIDNNLHRLFLSFRKKIKDFYIRIQKNWLNKFFISRILHNFASGHPDKTRHLIIRATRGIGQNPSTSLSR